VGARIGIVWTLSRALGPAREDICALKFLKGYIVSGCWELKRKFRFRSEVNVPIIALHLLMDAIVELLR
jgi:hypothetical protein